MRGPKAIVNTENTRGSIRILVESDMVIQFFAVFSETCVSCLLLRRVRRVVAYGRQCWKDIPISTLDGEICLYYWILFFCMCKRVVGQFSAVCCQKTISSKRGLVWWFSSPSEFILFSHRKIFPRRFLFQFWAALLVDIACYAFFFFGSAFFRYMVCAVWDDTNTFQWLAYPKWKHEKMDDRTMSLRALPWLRKTRLEKKILVINNFWIFLRICHPTLVSPSSSICGRRITKN